MSDVLHNTYYVASHGQWLASFYVAQVVFCSAVLALIPFAMAPYRAAAR
ncbi:hypothetical protein [Paraburkholderia sp. J63]|nr:hypothetical protein [Paraburkholderia sp. J63]